MSESADAAKMMTLHNWPDPYTVTFVRIFSHEVDEAGNWKTEGLPLGYVALDHPERVQLQIGDIPAGGRSKPIKCRKCGVPIGVWAALADKDEDWLAGWLVKLQDEGQLPKHMHCAECGARRNLNFTR